MKRRALTEREIEQRERRLRRALRLSAVLLVLLMIVTGKRREYTYKKVIYDYERGTSYASSVTDTSLVPSRIGKPNKPYYLLPRKPRYKHFWDSY